MDYSLIAVRLGEQIRQRRLNRGLTQAKLSALAGITRQKVIAIEKGDLSVGMAAYARVLGALDGELTVVPAVMPTLEEIQGISTNPPSRKQPLSNSDRRKAWWFMRTR